MNPAELVQQFQNIDKRYGEQAMTAFESEYAHRHRMESRGMVFGFIIGIFALTCGAVLVYLGQPWGAAFNLTSVTALASAFVKRPRTPEFVPLVQTSGKPPASTGTNNQPESPPRHVTMAPRAAIVDEAEPNHAAASTPGGGKNEA